MNTNKILTFTSDEKVKTTWSLNGLCRQISKYLLKSCSTQWMLPIENWFTLNISSVSRTIKTKLRKLVYVPSFIFFIWFIFANLKYCYRLYLKSVKSEFMLYIYICILIERHYVCFSQPCQKVFSIEKTQTTSFSYYNSKKCLRKHNY